MIDRRELATAVVCLLALTACGTSPASHSTMTPSTQSRPAMGPGEWTDLTRPVPAPDKFLNLEVRAAEPQAAACDAGFRPGEKLLVSAHGFLADTPVRIYSTSPGQKSLEQEVASVNADHAGAVSTTVVVPPDAIGFATPLARIVSVEAIGLGPANEHADAIGVVTLAQPGTPCG